MFEFVIKPVAGKPPPFYPLTLDGDPIEIQIDSSMRGIYARLNIGVCDPETAPGLCTFNLSIAKPDGSKTTKAIAFTANGTRMAVEERLFDFDQQGNYLLTVQVAKGGPTAPTAALIDRAPVPPAPAAAAPSTENETVAGGAAAEAHAAT